MHYNPSYLDFKPIFSKDELLLLEQINQELSLDIFLHNQNLIEKFGFDFVYTSAKIEGNTYTKAEALTLLEYGKTSGGKSYSDAKMLINLNKGYKFILEDDCTINKHKIRMIHHILADDLIDDNALGSVRQKGVLIKGSDYIPLRDALTLESELDRVLNIAETISNPYEKALYLHNSLAYLQYFEDVNKRTARMILNLSLKCDGRMLLIPQEEYISIYINGILEFYEKGSTHDIREFFIKSYQKMYDIAKEVI